MEMISWTQMKDLWKADDKTELLAKLLVDQVSQCSSQPMHQASCNKWLNKVTMLTAWLGESPCRDRCQTRCMTSQRWKTSAAWRKLRCAAGTNVMNSMAQITLWRQSTVKWTAMLPNCSLRCEMIRTSSISTHARRLCSREIKSSKSSWYKCTSAVGDKRQSLLISCSIYSMPVLHSRRTMWRRCRNSLESNRWQSKNTASS